MEAFSFVNLDCVICRVHLIPAFTAGPTDELLDKSFVHTEPLVEGWQRNEDWTFLYVNIFVNRDMFMCYRGGGIGHKMTRDCDEILHAEGQHDPLEDSKTSDDSEEDELNEDNVPEDEELTNDPNDKGIDMDA
ncbi:hypothetical protein HD554DRAFT_2304192, partial [Boletus coccyginus]